MSVKPDTPITKKEMYLDAATGGSSSLPEPVTIEEKYLAKIAGMTVDLPAPVPLKHKFLAKIAGMQIDVPTYTTGLPRIYAYLAKAAGQDVEVPQPITREEMYWFDYCGGTPTPPEREYTGAVPVTFVADGTPLLDYIISGNTAQSGKPTPDSPIMPQGTGERTGNLFDISSVIYGTWTDNSGKTQSYGYGARSINISSNQITASFNGSEFPYSYSVIWLNSNDEFIGRNHISSSTQIRAPQTFSPPSNAAKFYIQLAKGTDSSHPITIEQIESYKLMLNLGSTALPYEPYGYKIPISSAATTTPVYLGEVESTRRIKKLVLTGEEGTDFYRKNTTSSDNSLYYIRFSELQSVPLNGSPLYCTHLPNINYTPSDVVGITIGYAYNVIYFNLGLDVMNAQPSGNTIAGLKEYLAAQYAAGTPVTVWYVLATEETAIVNEPLMKIGDYADTLSMEQAGVSVPTVAGSNTLDVLTEVKPSEVYIKYNGEPVSQLSMLSSPGTDEPEEAPEELSEEVEEMPEEEEEEVPEETESITPETAEE